jgi:hypothetical protein
LVRRKIGNDTMKTKTKKSRALCRFVSRSGLAARWDCSPDTIVRMQKRGELLPTVFAGRFLRYNLEDVERIERECRVGSKEEREVPHG